MQQGGPAQPEIRFRSIGLGYIVKDHQGVGEVLLVAAAFDGFHSLEGAELGQDVLQQAGPVHKLEGHRRPRREQHLVEFLGDPLHREYAEAVRHTAHRVKGFLNYSELQLRSGKLGCEAHGPEHTQRVIRIGRVRVERSADNAVCEVADAPERVNQLSEGVFLKGESHCIDGEIAPELVVTQGAVFHYGLAGLAPVGFFAGTHELDFRPLVMEHCGSEIFEIGDIFPRYPAHFTGKLDSAALNYYIYVVAFPSEEAVTYIASDCKGTHAAALCHVAYDAEDFLVQILRYYCRHKSISSYRGSSFRGSNGPLSPLRP